MVATKPVDFRKGAEGLAALLGELKRRWAFTSRSLGSPIWTRESKCWRARIRELWLAAHFGAKYCEQLA
jgi:hypothetical protein